MPLSKCPTRILQLFLKDPTIQVTQVMNAHTEEQPGGLTNLDHLHTQYSRFDTHTDVAVFHKVKLLYLQKGGVSN